MWKLSLSAVAAVPCRCCVGWRPVDLALERGGLDRRRQLQPGRPAAQPWQGRCLLLFFLLLVVGVAARARLVSHVSMSLVLRSLGHRLCCARVTRALRSR